MPSHNPSDHEQLAHFLTGPQVCERYAITSMSLWRWLEDAELNFPPPALRIKNRRYWRETDLRAWELKQVKIAAA
jgi:predicted DNA-binding transcriptional regulator AlpA